MLQKISKNVSQYIKSQQYIVDTYTIVKELIENSLDAGSTVIKVIVNEEITIEDNGIGIEDLNSVCKSGFTSKEETTYKVLGMQQSSTVFSHGFRGQALASINDMCNVEILTRCSNAKIGRYKNYNTNIESFKPREPGTTIKVTNLFKNCPLRKNADEKSIRKSISKILLLFRGFSYVYDVELTLVFKNKIIFNEKGSSETKKHSISKHGEIFLQVEDQFFSLFLFPFDKTETQIFLMEKRICKYEKAESIIKNSFKQYFNYKPTFIMILRDDCDVNISSDKSEIILNNCKYVENKIKSELDSYFSLKSFIHGNKEKTPELTTNLSNDKVNNEIKVDLQKNSNNFESNVMTKTENVIKDSNNISKEIESSPVNKFLENSTENQKIIVNEHIPNKNSVSESKDNEENKYICNSNSKYEFNRENPLPYNNKIEFTSGNSLHSNSKIEFNEIENPFVISDTPTSKNDETASHNCCGVGNHSKSIYNEIKEESLNHSSCIFNKEDFKNLQIIGQFNQGFILCALEKDNKRIVMVVDQHAADEIYNFEKLKKSFKLKKQKLLIPLELNLTALQQLAVEDNKEIFSSNGFDVFENKLLSIPVYFGCIFTVDDFYQLLENISNEIFITDKLRNIMASKACRSSVMIGTCLGTKEMRNILDNLGLLEAPWNCPHGRPTFKILTEL